MPVLKKDARRRKNAIALAIFVTVSVIFCSPILRNIHYWGQHDWDQFSFWNGVARNTILKCHQLPLWNPYASGGNIFLAHPHSMFLSPFFLFVLALGVVPGLKIEIIAYMVVGMLGMYQLSRYYRLNRISSYAPPAIFMLSSVYCLHLDEGHASWLPLALIPWAFLCYLKSEDKRHFAAGSAISLVLMSFAGSVDILSITLVLLLVHSFWETVQQRKLTPVVRIASVLLLAFLIAAIKLVPVIEFAVRNPRIIHVSDGVSMPMLARILVMARHPLAPDTLRKLGQKHAWHEYGAYIGMLPLVLFLAGCILECRRKWPTVITALMMVLILMGDKSPVNLWRVLHSLPFYRGLSVPSRYVSAFLLFVSIFAGFGLSFIEGALVSKKWGRLVPIFVILVIAGNLTAANRPVFNMTFRTTPLEMKQEPVFRQRFRKINFYDDRVTTSSMYPILLSNSGILEAYEIMNVKKGDVHIEGEPEYRGEAYLLGDEGSCSVTYFSPNKVIVDVRTEENDIIILNQNYYDGWRVKGVGKAGPHSGLVSTRIGPGSHRVVFYYLPASFLIGLFITGVTIIVMLSYSLSRQTRSITHRLLRIQPWGKSDRT